MNIDYLLEWYFYRSLIKTANAAAVLGKHIKKDKKHFDEAWNLSAIDLLKASWAHGYLILMENFVAAVKTCENTSLKEILYKLCVFFATSAFLDDDWAGIIPPN